MKMIEKRLRYLDDYIFWWFRVCLLWVIKRIVSKIVGEGKLMW